MGAHFFQNNNFSIRAMEDEISIHTKCDEGWIFEVGFDRKALEEVLQLLIQARTYWDNTHAGRAYRENTLPEGHHMHTIGERMSFHEDTCPVCPKRPS